MTARKQLTNKEKVQRKHPGAWAYRRSFGEGWDICRTNWAGITKRLATASTPALAWAAAARVMFGDWREELRQGFAECFRVLKPEGTLIFKWNERDIKVREILALTPAKPLFGNKHGRLSQSHWIVFMKETP